ANPAPGAVPLPVSATVCGLPPALSTTDSVPVRAPETVGVKVTRSEERRAGKEGGGRVGPAYSTELVAAKSTAAPTERMVKSGVPVFVTGSVLGVLFVGGWCLEVCCLEGANPAPGAVPLPVSATVCGLPPALSTTDSVPVRAPETVGVKVT